MPAGRASLQMAGATAVAALFALAFLVAMVRVMGPAQYSDLAVCLSLTYVAMLFLGPLNLTLIRFSAAYQSHDNAAQIRPLLGHAARLYAPWIAGAIVLSIVLARPIADALNVGTPALVPWTGLLAGLGITLGAVRGVALGLNQHRLYSGSVLLETLVRVAAGATLALASRSAGGVLAGFLIGSAAALVALAVPTWRLVPVSKQPWSDSAEMSGFMMRALAFSAVLAGLQNVDMIAAKMRLAPEAAGDYAIALAVARGFLLLAGPFAGVALARPVPATGAGFRARILQVPALAYLAMCAPAVAALLVAPAPILGLLFGGHTVAQAQFVPILAMAFALAGTLHVLAHGEIRAGRFAFLVPLALIMAIELAILASLPSTPLAIAWTVLVAQGAGCGVVLGTPRLLAQVRRFDGSARYWDDRYARGGASGGGSEGKFAQFKADVLNAFVERQRVQTVIELGCGDGQQLALARYPSYLGFDVSPRAVQLCRTRFGGDASKAFAEVAEYAGERADLTLSLDVIYHLVEDEVFDTYMQTLFDASTRWVIVYASNHDDNDPAEAAHVRHRQFTRWVEVHRPGWALREQIPNRYPFTGDFRLGSFSDFFIFERA